MAHIVLDRLDSPLVWVEKTWLERKNVLLVVRGYVIKRLDTKDMIGTHLDMTLFDAGGQVLRTTVEHFEPRQIPRRHHTPDSTTYRVVLDPLPPGTARIEVRAQGGRCFAGALEWKESP